MSEIWKWTFQNRDGETVDLSAASVESFDSQADAETWLGEEYPSLVEQGVDDVSLYNGETKVYGPMSLHPAS